MKTLLLLLVLTVVSLSYAGIVPASTTLLRSSSSIAYPSAFVYSQQHAPVAVSYSAPVAYSHALAPTVYSQQLLTPSAHYVSPVLAHGPVFAQQSIYAQYPGLIAQSPVVAQYPVAQAPVAVGQYPGAVLGPSQVPTQDGSLAIEAADSPPNAPPQPPAQLPQQSPIVAGASPGTAVDDDTVSVEAA